MGDSLKVFKNEEATPTASLSSFSIPLLTTSATEKASIKDIRLTKTGLTEETKGFYKYPTVLKVDGHAISDEINLFKGETSTPLILEGFQIVDSSSSVTLEIKEEAPSLNYGTAEILARNRTQSKIESSYYKFRGNSPSSQIESDIAQNLEANKTEVSETESAGRSGIIKIINGQKKYFYTDGSTLYILDSNGDRDTTYSWPVTSYFIAVDDTYVYGITSSNNTQILRYNHSTNTAASDLTASASNYAPSTNNGWIDYYDGFIYLLELGSSSLAHKIDVSTGATTSFTCATYANAECLGGVITVNENGVPLIIMHGDRNCGVHILPTGTNLTQSSTFNPTTVQNNNVICIGYGLALINDGSYDRAMIIDANGIQSDYSGSFTQHDVSSSISLPNQGELFIGGEFKDTPSSFPRNLDYHLFSSGVLSN